MFRVSKSMLSTNELIRVSLRAELFQENIDIQAAFSIQKYNLKESKPQI